MCDLMYIIKHFSQPGSPSVSFAKTKHRYTIPIGTSPFPTTTSSIDSSRWRTLLLGWCFLRRGTTISPHFSDNCTGWRRRSESSSSLPSMFTSVGSGQRHRTSSKNYASQQTLRLNVVCAQPHHHHWLSAVRGCLPSAIMLFRSLPHVFGTVCRCTSRLHPRCLFFAVVWRRTSSDAAFCDSIFCFFLSCLWSDLS